VAPEADYYCSNLNCSNLMKNYSNSMRKGYCSNLNCSNLMKNSNYYSTKNYSGMMMMMMMMNWNS